MNPLEIAMSYIGATGGFVTMDQAWERPCDEAVAPRPVTSPERAAVAYYAWSGTPGNYRRVEVVCK